MQHTVHSATNERLRRQEVTQYVTNVQSMIEAM